MFILSIIKYSVFFILGGIVFILLLTAVVTIIDKIVKKHNKKHKGDKKDE